MPAKLTLDEIRPFVEKHNYTLVSKDYVNNSTKLDFRCPLGHNFSTIWNSFRRGKRCAKCARNCRLTIEEIRPLVAQDNYILVSSDYVNASTKLNFICPRGHDFSMTWNSFQQGQRCPICAGNIRLTIEEILPLIHAENYILLSKSYVNANTKLDFQCPSGHNFNMSWYHFKSGNRCTYCSHNAPITIEDIKNYIDKQAPGYNLFSTKYINAKKKLYFSCPNNHVFLITWDSFRAGVRCVECSRARHQNRCTNEANTKFTEIKKTMAESGDGYILISTKYKNMVEKLTFQCPQKHIFSMSWGNFQKGTRCAKCWRQFKQSRGVKRIVAYLQNRSIEFTQEYRIPECKNIFPLPFDFHLTQFDILIEYHGEQHYGIGHAFGATDKEKMFKDQQLRDQIKQEYCTQSGIPLLIIPYTDKNIEETISNFLENLGVTQSSSAIRLCEEEKKENKASIAWGKENHTISVR